MKIGGLVTMTLIDYPGKVAATIFTANCNLRCPFCHNGNLVVNEMFNNEQYSEKDILSFLKKRQSLLDGVCISGGEPTLNPDLPELLCQIKSLGYLIKLDTNGYNTSAIQNLYEGHLIDYIAMDIKSSFDNYPLATGIPNININPFKESIDYIINCGIEHEFRTTLVKGIHSLSDITNIANYIKKSKAYYLQSYQKSENIINSKGLESFSNSELKEFLSAAKNIFPNTMLREVK